MDKKKKHWTRKKKEAVVEGDQNREKNIRFKQLNFCGGGCG